MKISTPKHLIFVTLMGTLSSALAGSVAWAGGNPDEPILQSQRERVQPQEEYQPPVAAEAMPSLAGFEPFWEIGGYLGYLKARNTSVDTPLATPTQFDTGWKESNSDSPYNWGLRATRWYAEGRGIEVDYAESRLKADAADIVPVGLSRLDIDRLRSLTVSHIWRFDNNPIFTLSPYAGLGASLDYVRAKVVQTNGLSVSNGEPAGIGLGAKLGLTKALTEQAAVFVETRYAYRGLEFDISQNDVDIDLETLGINLGLSYAF
jgi:opacity protein-like surface antigen